MTSETVDLAPKRPVVQESLPAKPELLFILSPSFSGSTLLTFLLASHPDIATVGELKASALGDISTYHCSCGALLEQCGFWVNLREATGRRGDPLAFADFGTHFVRSPLFFRRLIRLGVSTPLFASMSEWALRFVPAWRERREKILDRNQLLIELITAEQGRRVFLDGSKDPEQLQQLVKSRRWNVRGVRLLRDGRGIVNSYIKHHEVDVQSAAREWLRTERACARVTSGMAPEDVLTVKYEDVCEDPRREMNRIFQFVGLSKLNTLDSSEAPQLHILGNAMRLNPDKSIQHDERWKTQLLPLDLDRFNEIAGSCNLQRGYSRGQ